VRATNINNGTASAVTSGTLEITGAVTGNGALQIAPGATLRLDGSIASGQAISFNTGAANATAILNGVLASVNNFAISNLQALDRLELGNGVTATAAVLSAGTLTVSYHAAAGGTQTYQFTNVGTAAGSPSTFITGNDATTGDSFVQVTCFAEGTLIQTTQGPIAVEHLRPDMELPTALGNGPEAIVWTGQRSVNCRAHPKPETVWPIRVASGAFGAALPVRDLFLSPDHAVFVNGVLVPVKFLVNGTSIAQVRRDNVTYFHVELRHHDVILAEGLPVESYLDLDGRQNFGGDGAVIQLHPNFASWRGPDAASAWETRGAAPLVTAGPALAAARQAALSEAKSRRLA
jgi:hypothetical protein